MKLLPPAKEKVELNQLELRHRNLIKLRTRLGALVAAGPGST